MAIFNFRQGIARRQEDGIGNGANLQPSNGGSYVDLVVSPDPTNFIIAHFDVDYLFTENVSVSRAWGPFTGGTDYWLYWDIDFITGALSRGYTTFEPVHGTSAPASPEVDQHWFDRNNNVMKVWTGSTWLEKLRVFAAKYQSGATLIYYPIGSQVGISGVKTYAGAILYDPDNKPLQIFQPNRRGQFITTETPLHSQFARIANFRVEAAIVQGEATENIPLHYAVTYSDYNKLVLARTTTPDRPVIGISAEEMNTGEVRSFITKGFVTNTIDWNWSAYPVNTPLFLGPTGQLVTTPPISGLVQQIGRVIDAETIYVDIGPALNFSASGGNFVPIQIDRDTGRLAAKAVPTTSPGECIRPAGVNARCVFGYEHVQTSANTIWTIAHNFGTDRALVEIYDNTGIKIIPDEISIIDINTVQVNFNTALAGKAQLVLLLETA